MPAKRSSASSGVRAEPGGSALPAWRSFFPDRGTPPDLDDGRIYQQFSGRIPDSEGNMYSADEIYREWRACRDRLMPVMDAALPRLASLFRDMEPWDRRSGIYFWSDPPGWYRLLINPNDAGRLALLVRNVQELDIVRLLPESFDDFDPIEWRLRGV